MLDAEMTNVFTEMVGAVKQTIDLYGEQAVDLSLLVVQLGSIKQLVYIVPFIIVVVVSCRLLKTCMIALKKNYNKYEGPAFEDAFRFIVVMIALIVGAIGTVGNMKYLFDPVLWASAIGYPEVEVARMIINSTIGN